MNAHDGGILTRWFTEPLTVAERYHADHADVEQRARESRVRQDRQQAEVRDAVDRLLGMALGDVT
jgi:hypothetical protein